MTRIAILGAGAGAAAAVVELTLAGHETRLWNRSAATLAPFEAAGGVAHDGVFGDGLVRPSLITTDLCAAVDGAALVLVCLPTFSHPDIATALARAGLSQTPVALNPGHTGGALEFRTAFRAVSSRVPPIAEFSTLTYVARKYRPERVSITGKVGSIRLAGLPGGEAAVEQARALYPAARVVPDVLACDLANVNMVLHPPGAMLAAAWTEATGGDFTFYVQGMTPGVARVMRSLDSERLAVAAAFGHELPSLLREMQALGTVSSTVTDFDDYAAAISGGEANARIKAPDSLQHRYYREDFGHGLLPFIALADAAGVEVPVARSLLTLASALTGIDYRSQGRTAARMGIDGMGLREVLECIRR